MMHEQRMSIRYTKPKSTAPGNAASPIGPAATYTSEKNSFAKRTPGLLGSIASPSRLRCVLGSGRQK